MSEKLATVVRRLRNVLASDADTILRQDFLNAVRRAWQFSKSATEKEELAMVYHKLKNGNDSTYAKAWNQYLFDVQSWLTIPVLEASYGPRNTAELEKGSPRNYPGNSKTWEVRGDDWNSQEIHEFLENASSKPKFYIRDLVGSHGSLNYMGKLWEVQRVKEGSLTNFVLKLVE